MSRKLLAGNWKMHKTRAECAPFFEAFAKECGDVKSLIAQADLLFAVPFTLLEAVRASCARPDLFAQLAGLKVAAQNVHWQESGAFTGEISVPHLRDLGVTHTLVGHSERRQYFAETDETVAQKIKACLNGAVAPIVCVGETKEERQSGRFEEVLSRQMNAVMDAAPADGSGITIAYEPVWAIGTGLSATADEANAAHQMIRGLWKKRFGVDAARSLTILYGGSANAGMQQHCSP